MEPIIDPKISKIIADITNGLLTGLELIVAKNCFSVFVFQYRFYS